VIKRGALLRDKTIRCQICYSKSLARCSERADSWFHRFLFLGDDWGRFEFDIDIIYPLLFARRIAEISKEDVAGWLKEYEDWGMLFRWSEHEREYGFWVNNDTHSPFTEKRRHKSKLPPPPEKELEAYKQRCSKKFLSEPKGKSSPPF